VLWGLAPVDLPVTVAAGDTVVASDENGLWYMEFPPDASGFTIQTPTATSKLGAKGAGEAGTAGAPAAVMNAINDALAPFGAHVFSQPITPQKVLRSLGKVR
jgi:CO/xanthine dehydrogenase Mo-binding subunit